jgi:circadian clock protein KaiC
MAIGPSPPRIERMSTGVRGLDVILGGGLPRRDLSLLVGAPGAGKTVLANQICFQRAREGGSVAYVTLLSETHTSMLGKLRTLDYFDARLIPEKLVYLSGYHPLQEEGLSGFLTLIRSIGRDRKPEFLVIDGFGILRQFARSTLEVARFVYDLQAFVGMIDCTALLVSVPTHEPRVEEPVVDCILELTHRLVGLRAVRWLSVRKTRGCGYITGRHSFEISKAGATVHPRVEAILGAKHPAAAPLARTSTGVAGLDDMLKGGLVMGSSSLLLGAPGTGKTLMSLQFLVSGARRGERGVMLGFNEMPGRLRGEQSRLTAALDELCERGLIEIIWHAPVEHAIDAIASELLEAIGRTGASRVVIDGVAGIRDGARPVERTGRYLAALTNELRARRVTSLLTHETRIFAGPDIDLRGASPSSIVENIVFVQQLRCGVELRRIVSVLKTRGCPHDLDARAFSIGEDGAVVEASAAGARRIFDVGLRAPEGVDRPSGRRPRARRAERR